jgi:hypothetical protein
MLPLWQVAMAVLPRTLAFGKSTIEKCIMHLAWLDVLVRSRLMNSFHRALNVLLQKSEG